MKSIPIPIIAIITMLVVACQKSEMKNSNFNVDTQSYETKLNSDYNNALQYHNLLIDADAYNSNLYMMFNICDSLFSEHFYAFCIDMMQNSGMMSTADGMMGTNSGMMSGNGEMMNGNHMGSHDDMNNMMKFMDSVHHMSQTMPHADYMFTDSLMHNQMSRCNMLTDETDSIETIYGNMHIVRKNHKKMHGN